MYRSRSSVALGPEMPGRNSLQRQSRSYTRTPTSPAPSRESSGHRSSRHSMHAKTPRASSADRIHPTSSFSHYARSGVPQHSFAINENKRWDGTNRTTTEWDCLRRDPELWFPAGDCLVHFYERGQSRRGPSLRLLLADIESSNCRPLLEQSCAEPVPESPVAAADSCSDDGGYSTNPSLTAKYELYIPAPGHLNRREAFRYHMTTRNFFAWMFELPLVGEMLGASMISLLGRMNQFRPDPEENQDDMLAYLDNQGYTDFRECPDHALAVLQFAEHFRYRDLWTDAYVHCVGMNDILLSSREFNATSRISKALISRASMEMGIRLERSGESLGNFLEDDLAATLGLSSQAQKHMDRFRSFLTSFYVQRHGYWPPASTNWNCTGLPQTTLRSIYFDVRHLYDYLADPCSTALAERNKPTSGGVCILQNIIAFDKKFKYAPLPHPLPRIPDHPDASRDQKVGTFSLFGRKQAKQDRRMAALSALTAATNRDDMTVMECALVREYFRFEREWTVKGTREENLSSADARQVRWILVYALLQTLVSVTRAPTEVRDTDGISYSLCCQIGGTPPWDGRSKQAPRQPTYHQPPPNAVRVDNPAPRVKRYDANDLPFRSASFSSEVSVVQPIPVPPRSLARPIPVENPSDAIIRHTAILTPTIAPIRHLLPSAQRRQTFCEIVVRGYGNGSGILPSLPRTPCAGKATATESDHEPQTPSSGGSSSEDHHAWSAKGTNSDDGRTLPIMDHVSLWGDSPSLHGDDNDAKSECDTPIGYTTPGAAKELSQPMKNSERFRRQGTVVPAAS